MLVSWCQPPPASAPYRTTRSKQGAAAGTASRGLTWSSLHGHRRELLLTEYGADITFEADGVTFGAHRYVLAAQLLVLKATVTKVFGSMMEGEEASMFQHFLEAVDRFNL
ncbi:hypothetical protein ACP70R_019293 [Stipagrostis hirtigluma subsp. patula]